MACLRPHSHLLLVHHPHHHPPPHHPPHHPPHNHPPHHHPHHHPRLQWGWMKRVVQD